MAIFNCASKEFQFWLDGMEHERGFSKVLTKEADFRVSTSIHAIFHAESLLADFLVLKDDVSYVVFSFRNMVYLFKGSCDEVEAKVRSLPLGRTKLPARKMLVKSIAESLSRIFRVMRGRTTNDGENAARYRVWLDQELSKPEQQQDQLRIQSLRKGLSSLMSPQKEPETPREIRNFLKNSSPYLNGKDRKQLEYYIHREDGGDDIIQDAINIVLTEDVLLS